MLAWGTFMKVTNWAFYYQRCIFIFFEEKKLTGGLFSVFVWNLPKFSPSSLGSSSSLSKMQLEQRLSFASQRVCLMLSSVGGRLQSRALQNKGGRSPVIGESWTSVPVSICHDSLSSNLQSVKSALPGWRLQEIWCTKHIWQQHYHCKEPAKCHQCVNCNWLCKVSLPISFNTSFASFAVPNFLHFINIWIAVVTTMWSS